MAGDSLMDDPSSINAFFDHWEMKKTNTDQSLVGDDDLNKETKVTAVEGSSGKTLTKDDQQQPSPARKAIPPAQWETPTQQSDPPRKIANSIEPSSFKSSTPHDQSFAPSPVISVAHRSSKIPPSPAPLFASENKLDQDLETEPLRPLTTMTPSQRRLFEKTNPVSFNKHQELAKNPFKKETIPKPEPQVGTRQSSTEDEPVVSAQKPETRFQQQSSGPVEVKKGNGLMDSVHARSATGRLHFKAPYTPQSQQNSPTNPQSSSPVRTEDGSKYGTMEYFDNKRKEYYPPSSENGPKAMLQSKDPNAPLRSPKKPTSRLNPQAKAYSAADPEVKQEEELITAVPDFKDETATTEAPSRENKNTAGEACLTDAEHETVPTVVAEMAREMEHVLKVLNARVDKTSLTSADQEVDNVPTYMVEEEASPVMTVVGAPPKNVNIASRTLMLKNLPNNSDYTLVQSVIHGATILSMNLMQDKNCAQILLTDSDDCQKFVETCENGVEIKHNGIKHTVFIEVLPEVDEIDSRLDAYLECGATRVIQAGDVDVDLTMRNLHQLASGSTPSREVEAINDSFSGGIRRVTFRFTSIQDAVAFRKSLRSDTEWKNKMEFVKDPCT